MKKYLAITSKGLENLLADELIALGVTDPKLVYAGVTFEAPVEVVYRCCLWSRIASRFVQILSEFDVRDDMDLYLGASAINWPNYFTADKTLVVDFNGTNREIRNSQYGALKVKDAIVDRFTKADLERPNIDKAEPDLRIHMRLSGEKGILGFDLIGSGLHQRGYRTEAGRAPLRETLAAALVLRSTWDESKPLLDPMCGSGTLLIEAALMACEMAPGVKREKWCFEALNDFDAELWAEIRSEARVKSRRGVKKVDTQGFENGVVICNPPYGERLSTEPALIALYSEFGRQLKEQFGGCTASIYSSNDDLLACIRMRADKQFKLNNGALPCVQKNYSITESAERKEAVNVEVAPEFMNRLKKNLSKIGKWARKEKLECYRLYDADLPDYNAAIDVYKDYIIIQEYAAPKEISEDKARRRLTDMIRATVLVTGVETNNVILKVRQKQSGKNQYQKLAEKSRSFDVDEYGVKLIVNLQDYLDTGLFLDHKLTRKMIGEMAAGKDFLNLFAYTGSATVHAACGGAKSTMTIDMSRTYLEWAQKNMNTNDQTGTQHQFLQADCLQWLQQAEGEFDLIFIDPPTFSNSKRMEQTFDVQRDHIMLLENLKRMLRENGTIVFSNNKRNFKMDDEALEKAGLQAKNISKQTLPLDFARNKHIHNCWIITHKED
ncbi:UNVERIFIED_CONTAM: hypothetical protein GTU68_042544 [Idotea baltica]|nr:hypothetical protein [Idotea baltica]